jgi:lantibiotic modifying enzyme
MAWCHGAPGIGLSRLRNAEILPDNVEIARDLEAALQTTAATLATPWKPGSGNYSLCHGATGNAELMMMAGQKLQRPALTAVAEKVGQEGIEYYVKQGLPWPCGNNGAGEAPGLMLGLAGIGHFYLRLFDPVQVPSVLIITP